MTAKTSTMPLMISGVMSSAFHRLDSAHDSIPTYELLEHWDVNALININGRAKSSKNAPDDITFNKDGRPLCKTGHKMCPRGNDPAKDAHKYRCPLKCKHVTACHTKKNVLRELMDERFI